MDQENRNSMVSELIGLLNKGNAHVTLEKAVANIPANLRTVVPDGLPYSIWQLVEHLRITQKDILDFSISDDYQELAWPDEYWVENKKEVSDEEWQKSLDVINADQEKFIALLKDQNADFFSPFKWGQGQNLFREALLIGDHNAYHTAEIVVIRRLLKCWK